MTSELKKSTSRFTVLVKGSVVKGYFRKIFESENYYQRSEKR